MELYDIKGEIYPKPPFDFHQTLDFANMFLPSKDEQRITDLTFTKSIYLLGETVAFKLTGKGTIEDPVLSYELFSYHEIDKKTESELLDRISFFLSLKDDLIPFYKLGRKDPDFNEVIETLYGLHQVKFLTPFEAAVWAVLSQRISMKAVHTMKDRLVKMVGNHIEVDGVDYWAFPGASQIRKLSVEKLLDTIKNHRKTEYIMAVAEAFDQVDEQFLREGDLEEVKDWLINIKGIGAWSAHLELIKGIGRMEGVLEHDKCLYKCAQKVYGFDITGEKFKKISESYGDYKGYWNYYIRAVC